MQSPPRKVRFTKAFHRSIWLGALLVFLVVGLIGYFGFRDVRGYERLIKVGVPAQARVEDLSYNSRGNANAIAYQIPGQRASTTYSDHLPSGRYSELESGSHVLVTIDPANPDDHVFGIPTQEGLTARVNLWEMPLILVIVAGLSGLCAALLAAFRDRRVLTMWEFEWAEVVISEYRRGQAACTQVVVRISQGTSPTRTYFLRTLSDLVAGDHVDVLFDPRSGSVNVRPLDSVTYVELR